MSKKHLVTGQRRIFILDAAVCDAEADVEAAYTLDAEERRILAHAKTVCLKVTAASETGSANFDIDSVAIYDGTNWFTVETFSSAITINAAGVAYKALSNPFGYGTQLKLLASVTTLDGSNYITLTAVLEVTADRQYEGGA